MRQTKLISAIVLALTISLFAQNTVTTSDYLKFPKFSEISDDSLLILLKNEKNKMKMATSLHIAGKTLKLLSGTLLLTESQFKNPHTSNAFYFSGILLDNSGLFLSNNILDFKNNIELKRDFNLSITFQTIAICLNLMHEASSTNSLNSLGTEVLLGGLHSIAFIATEVFSISHLVSSIRLTDKAIEDTSERNKVSVFLSPTYSKIRGAGVQFSLRF